MTTKKRILRPVLFSATFAWIWAAGAAATVYASDMSGLTEISQPGFDSAFAKSGALPTGFTSVYVAPVGVIEGQDKTLDALTEADREEMQDYLYRQLTRELGKKFALADGPGPGVLIVEASFNALKSNKPTRSDLERNPGIDYGKSFGVGAAGVRIDLRDGATGDLLAAFVDHETGEPLDSNLRAIVRWGDAEQFARDWARDLARTLGG